MRFAFTKSKGDDMIGFTLNRIAARMRAIGAASLVAAGAALAAHGTAAAQVIELKLGHVGEPGSLFQARSSSSDASLRRSRRWCAVT